MGMSHIRPSREIKQKAIDKRRQANTSQGGRSVIGSSMMGDP